MEGRARLLRALPVEERRVVVNGVSTVVLEGGDGPPLLLLHGGIECGGAYWAPVVPRSGRSPISQAYGGATRSGWMRSPRTRAPAPGCRTSSGRCGNLISAGTKQVHDHLDVPTTLLWGAQDRFVPPALAVAAGERWPLHVIDDAGHVPHIERPDAFLEVVTRTRS